MTIKPEHSSLSNVVTAARSVHELARPFRKHDEAMWTLQQRHADRSRILGSAFSAHERGEFDLSVPVLLSQAEGICKAAVAVSPYERRDKEPRIAEYVRSLSAESFRAAALQPLLESIPLTASARDREPGFAQLNRHQVLHGESVDYGTELNSVKAVSFISYISYMLSGETNEPD
jgi:hypothetical protein